MRRYSLKSLLLVIAVVAVICAFVAYMIDRHRYAPVRAVLGGPEGFYLLRHAEKITVYRVQPPTKFQIDPTLEDLTSEPEKKYPVIVGPVPVAANTAKPLIDLLSDKESYVLDGAKDYLYQSEVRVDFIRGDHTLQVYFCFPGDVLVTYIDGQFVAIEDFDVAAPDVIRWVQSLFPDDERIQNLDKTL